MPLTDEAVRAFSGTVSYADEGKRSPAVFWHGKGQRYLNASSQLAAVRRRLEFAWTMHNLRHLFAVEYLRQRRGSIYDLQQVLRPRIDPHEGMCLRYLTPEE